MVYREKNATVLSIDLEKLDGYFATGAEDYYAHIISLREAQVKSDDYDYAEDPVLNVSTTEFSSSPLPQVLFDFRSFSNWTNVLMGSLAAPSAPDAPTAWVTSTTAIGYAVRNKAISVR